MNARVQVAPLAMRTLVAVRGLYDRVTERAVGVLGAAAELSHAYPTEFVPDGQLYFLIGEHLVWYELDVDAQLIRIVDVQSAEGAPRRTDSRGRSRSPSDS